MQEIYRVRYDEIFKSKSKDIIQQYGEAYLDVDPTRTEKFKDIVNQVPLDCLR